MEFLPQLGLLALGFTVLIIGGEALVRSAVSIALRFDISPATVGLTIVAAGTSAPELLTSIMATYKGAPDIAVGNIVGSNTFNILAILGISALMKEIVISKRLIHKELVLLVLFSCLFIGLSFDGQIHRWEGGVLVAALIGSIYYTLRTSRAENVENDDDIEPLKSWLHDIFYLSFGMAALVLGADWAIEGGVGLGQILGLSDRTIGIVIISAGTGLPELATSAVAAWRGQNDIAFANVVGSNIMNTLAVAGIAASIHPLKVSSQIIDYDNYVMLAVTVLLIPAAIIGKYRISKGTGLFFLIAYTAYVSTLLYR